MGWYTAWLSGALTNKHCNEKSVECWPWSTGSRSPSEHTHRNIRYRQKNGPNKDGTFKDSFNHIPQNKARLQSSAEAWIEECFEKVTIETKLEKKCKILSSQDTSLLSLSMYLHFSLSPPSFFLPLSAAATGDHVQHDSALSLLSHLHQSFCYLPGPAQVEVQPLLPGQWWYESNPELFWVRK